MAQAMLRTAMTYTGTRRGRRAERGSSPRVAQVAGTAGGDAERPVILLRLGDRGDAGDGEEQQPAAETSRQRRHASLPEVVSRTPEPIVARSARVGERRRAARGE